MGTQEIRFVLSSLLKEQCIKLNMEANHRDGALEELTNLIPSLVQQPDSKKTLLKALQEREQLCSTGIGDGIALPHCRNALVGLVDHPVLIFGRHASGIAFGSVDGNPARLFFLLVAPTVNQHLQILARLSRILRNPRLRKGLLTADKAEKIIRLIEDAEKNA